MTKSIKGLIFDLDNVLYRDPPGLTDFYAQAAAHAVSRLEPDADIRELQLLAKKSYELYGNEIELFWRTGRHAQDIIYEHYHNEAFELFRDSIKPLEGLKECFNRLSQKIVLLTHGSAGWARNLVALLDLKDHFHESNILSLDHPDIGFRRKNLDEAPSRIAIARLGLEPADIAMLDDTAPNLVFPRQLGVHTVHVDWNNSSGDLPPHVAERSYGPLPFLKLIS